MRIGELSQSTGASVRSLRYYEQQGLLESQRTPSGQRVYEPGAADRVRLLRRLYAAGLNSTTIAALMPCVDEPSDAVTVESVAIMRREHERIGAQISELVLTREHLAYLIEGAEASMAPVPSR